MRILALDTSTTTCSVGLICRDEAVETSYTSRKTHAAHLLGMIDDILKRAGTSMGEVDALAVVRGPGTFTGLRIGISTAKGLALACGKPLVGISGLDALAAQSAWTPHLICPMVDARRSEVYCACYRMADGLPRRVSGEMALPPARVLETIDERCLFVGEGAVLYRTLIEAAMGDLAVVAPPAQAVVRAATIARLAAERLLQGDSGGAEQLAPLYIRQSDAQLKLGKRQSASPQLH